MLDERSNWRRAWDVFLDVGVNLWIVWLLGFVFLLLAIDAVRRAIG